MKKRKTKKRFLPYFHPAFVEVIAVNEIGQHYALPIIEPIQYNAEIIRVFVRKP